MKRRCILGCSEPRSHYSTSLVFVTDAPAVFFFFLKSHGGWYWKKCIFSVFYSSFLHQWYFPVHCTYLHASPAAINQTAAPFFLSSSLHNFSIHTYVPSALERCVLILLDFKTISICVFLDPVHKSSAASETFISTGSLYSYFPVVGCWYSNPFRANKTPANKLWKETREKMDPLLSGSWQMRLAIGYCGLLQR